MFAEDSEAAVLNIVMLNPDLIFLIPSLKSFMFSSTPNQVVFSAITDLVESGMVPEYNLVLNYLKSKNKIKEAGDEGYLSYVRSLVFSKENIQEFSRQIIDSYKTRELVMLANTLSKIAMSNNEVDDTILKFRDSLDKLSANIDANSTTLLSDFVKESWDTISDKVKNPGKCEMPTGYLSLDRVTGGYHPGDIWYIASRPSMGKSAVLCNSVLRSAKQGLPTLVFSLEMQKQAIVERFLSIETGVSLSDIRLGILDQKAVNKIREQLNTFKDYPIYIDSNYSMSLEFMLSTIRKYHKQKGIKVVYLDYIQLLADRDDNQTSALGKISRALKLLANELKITIIILSQLSRGVEGRDDRRPILSDLRQSGNLEEDADLVVFLYRDDYYDSHKNPGQMEFIIRKHRNGPIGTLFFKFNGETNLVTE